MVKSQQREKSDSYSTGAKRDEYTTLSITQAEQQRLSHEEEASDEQRFIFNGVRYMLTRFVAYFECRATQDDQETLLFCLYHLFEHVDALYYDILPMLATLMQSYAHATTRELRPRHALWTRLQEVQLHVERIESLCHLLNRTTPRLLCTLDTLDDNLSSEQESRQLFLSSRQHQQPDEEMSSQLQQEYEQLSTRLKAWQERNEARFSSANTTPQPAQDTAMNATFSLIRPMLARIDAALLVILDCAGAIYGDIVPDFQGVSTGDDEVVATLLFDLMQQADLLLMQCDTLIQPLQELLKQYMLYD